MSEESKNQDPLYDLRFSAISRDRDFKVSLDEAEAVLGDADTIVRWLNAISRVEVANLAGLIFFNKHKTTDRLQIWQLVEFQSSLQRFKASVVVGERETFSIPVSLFQWIPFVGRHALAEMIRRAGGADKFPLPDKILGLSAKRLPSGVEEILVGTGDNVLMSVACPLEETPLKRAHPSESLHQDPFKSAAVQAIPLATASVLFTGMSENPEHFSANRSHTLFYEVLTSGGLAGLGEGEDETNKCLVTDSMVLIATPKQVAVAFLQLRFVNLAYFQPVTSDEAVYKAIDQGNRDFRAPMVIMEATEAYACWYNVKNVMNRLFLMTPEFTTKWVKVVTDFQELILNKPKEFPLLSSRGIVFEMLNLLARGFFNRISKPHVTVQQVQNALDDLFINPKSEWFRSIYTTNERLPAPRKRVDPPTSTATSGAASASPTHGGVPKKKVRFDGTASHQDKGAGKSGSKKPACFHFNSTDGCHDPQCPYHHEPITSKKVKAAIRKTLLKLKLDPDEAKLE